jgi:hypothetical protein
MTRSATLVAHVAALPLAVLVSVALAITLPPPAGVDIHLHDTFFVVAHFHFLTLLGAGALVATFVAHRYGVVTRVLTAAWALFGVHAIAAIVQWRQTTRMASPEAGSVAVVYPDPTGLSYIYLGSALAGLGALALALLASLWKSLRRQGQQA